MTVMPSSSDVADKAVSTEDASSGMEVARLEAVLAALVETKFEAMKASSSVMATMRRPGSAPPSPKPSRFTSSSTVSSSQTHQQHHHHQHQLHQHYQHHHQHRYDKRGRRDHKHRRHDSAPCSDFIQHPITYHHKQKHGKDSQKAVDSAKKHRRYSRSPHVISRDIHPGLDSRFELLDIDTEQDLALINFERTKEALGDGSEYQKLQRSACYISHSSAHLKSHYDEEDYLTYDFVDELDDEETFSGPAVTVDQSIKSAVNSRERYHRPRKKRRRPRCEKSLVDVEGLEVDDLPPRARWTIVATACLLLAMSLLLVGVTLRMAPIIDEMVRKENEELLNSLNRDSSMTENITALSF